MQKRQDDYLNNDGECQKIYEINSLTLINMAVAVYGSHFFRQL